MKPKIFEKCINYVVIERALHQIKYKIKFTIMHYMVSLPLTTENIFKMPHIMPVNNFIRGLQYKILFRIVAINKFLYQIKNYLMCLLSVHTVEDLYYECHTTKSIRATLTYM